LGLVGWLVVEIKQMIKIFNILFKLIIFVEMIHFFTDLIEYNQLVVGMGVIQQIKNLPRKYKVNDCSIVVFFYPTRPKESCLFS
jgi:hypothetical protein